MLSKFLERKDLVCRLTKTINSFFIIIFALIQIKNANYNYRIFIFIFNLIIHFCLK